MSEGRVAEHGAPRELLRQDGALAQLVRTTPGLDLAEVQRGLG